MIARKNINLGENSTLHTGCSAIFGAKILGKKGIFYAMKFKMLKIFFTFACLVFTILFVEK